mgnify:CR=1 FL=1
MGREDVRWKQRFSNYRRSVENLRDALKTTEPSKLERQGIVKAFELAYELAWKTLQDFLKELGYSDIVGPKPVIRQAFESGVIADGDGWARMHRARHDNSDLYLEQKAMQREQEIRNEYEALLRELAEELGRRLQREGAEA